MKKLSPKAKKITMITGIAVVCIGVLSVVLYQHASANNNIPATTSSAVSENLVTASSETVSAAPITGSSSVASGTAGTGSSFVPEKGKTVSAPLTKASKPVTPSKPVIQGDSQNGQQPTNKALTNKAQKPAYTTTPKAPTTQKPSGGSTSGGKTSGGNKKGNSVLDNAIKEQGGNQQTTAGDMYEDGTKVGIMD